MPSLSIVICTHNPDRKRIEQTLAGLRGQSLSHDVWELIVIDNASSAPLAVSLDLAWHPHGRVVREEELGLTAARLRGFSEARSDLIVFVDDDNVLAADYLANAIEVGSRFPWLGLWGGSITGRFEKTPEPWIEEYLNFLAVRTIDRDTWGNGIPVILVPGAGMVVRKVIGRMYASLLESDPIRRSLDRKGASLSSAGDSDLGVLACEAGFGVGVFTSLQLEHLIPSGRITIDYMERLSENIGYSGNLMYALWGRHEAGNRSRSLFHRMKSAVGILQYPPEKRRIIKALARGAERARRYADEAGLRSRTAAGQRDAIRALAAQIGDTALYTVWKPSKCDHWKGEFQERR